LEDAGVAPEHAAKFQHVLTSAFIANPSDMMEIDISHVSLKDGDRLLLCSDGLYNMLGDAEISAELDSRFGPQTTSDRLVEQALEHGGKDNVTVIVADAHVCGV
jgi:protein phosphatase